MHYRWIINVMVVIAQLVEFCILIENKIKEIVDKSYFILENYN